MHREAAWLMPGRAGPLHPDGGPAVPLFTDCRACLQTRLLSSVALFREAFPQKGKHSHPWPSMGKAERKRERTLRGGGGADAWGRGENRSGFHHHPLEHPTVPSS